MNTLTKYFIFSCLTLLIACQPKPEKSMQPSEEQLIRHSYQSPTTKKERDYFVYLPKGYEDDPTKEWAVMLFLHGGGERLCV